MTKLGFFYVLKVGIALGAGWKIGKDLPDAIAYAMNKRNRAHYKRVYRQTVEKETARKRPDIHVVPDQKADPGDCAGVAWDDLREAMKNETPTGE